MSKIKPKECQDVEFKRIWKDEYLKWICGFANAQGVVVYLGVDGDHEVCGLKDSKKLLEDSNEFYKYVPPQKARKSLLICKSWSNRKQH